jgi:hypothetical protein
MFTGVRHRVRGPSCAAARKCRDKLIEAIPHFGRAGGLSTDEAERIEAEVLARAVWLESEGLVGDDGAAVIVNADTALALLSNPAYALLRQDIRACASLVGETELAAREEDTKNLSRP